MLNVLKIKDKCLLTVTNQGGFKWMTLKWCPQVGRLTVLRPMTVQMRLTVWQCCVTDRTNGPILRLISQTKRGIRSPYRPKHKDLIDCATKSKFAADSREGRSPKMPGTRPEDVRA